MAEKEELVETYDTIKNPQHYAGQGEVECIDFIEICIKKYNGIVAGCMFNLIKYIWRSHNKNGKEDLEKALWYANRGILLIKNNLHNCFSCATLEEKLDPSEELLYLKAVNQITSTLDKAEADCFLTIIACIVNGGLMDGTKDYSPNVISALENWINIYDKK